MKVLKRLVITFCVVAVMLASSVTVFAIGFNAEEIYDSVFVIYSGNSLGSGFAIGENCVITNAHVISNCYKIEIGTYNGEIYPAFLVAMDTTLDIAVLGVSEGSFAPLEIADLDKVNVGDDVCAIGAPNSLAYTLTKGVVSSKSRIVGKQKYIQTDAAINTGNSGGPLLTDTGEVIGVNSYKMTDSEGIGLAIPIDKVVEYLRTGDISLDESNHVNEVIIEESEEPFEEDERQESEIIVKTSPIIIVLLACSLALNIVLIIVLVIKKKKASAPQDPSERTDFDIEIYN